MIAWYNEGGGGDTQQSIANSFLLENTSIRALTADDNVIPSVFAVRPKFFQESIDYVKQGVENVILFPTMTDLTPATNGLYHYNIGSPGSNPAKFNPSFFAYRADVLAANFNTQKGAHSEYCFGFENNTVVAPYTQFGTIGNGRFFNTMYFQDVATGAPPTARPAGLTTF